jgi:ABC-type branched-subunit amino acid transport system ATPase component
LFLALATFGFGIMVEQLFYARGFMFTTLQSGRQVPRPSFATDDVAFYYVVLAMVVIVSLVVVVIRRARIGRMLQGMSESPTAVATMGLSTNTTRVIVFCISSFLAGVSGILYAASVHFATTSDSHFTSFYSLILLAVLALAPFAEPWYAIFALIAAVIPGYLTGENTTNWLNVLFGFFAIQVAMMGGPQPMPARLRTFFERFGRRRAPAEVGVELAAERPERVPASAGLEVDGLSVRFGGLLAVDRLSFKAPVGRITGLIGPNGAGKTTTFDACSGLNRRVEGAVRLHGEVVTKSPPAARARLGLGRTFQRMQLGDSLTVAENVALGAESSLAGASPLSQLASSKSQARATSDATASALATCGITGLAHAQAGSLSTGQRRLVELARCLAGEFDVLLLDEPSSGLDRAETAAFDEVLRNAVAERGCGILLVEHDMSLVMNVCDYIYVLDFGKLIFEGEPSTVASSAVVQAAYLGDDAVAPPEVQEATL